ncbi:hypothetical protein [Pseudomonas fontis]|uniref:DUF3077 domain-containing protein n=1 Tax=Pseudomonas fontis TaxID=2942633 RepID=A0ABT5NUR2_9PSED|nr:hypothetical protein [Pseudomonas fontis]MDD0975922.1 hypothetical protein [Pseudomonas fontis]MDD0991879.1 hypothetical protein [Pseudomonas fontis]
MKKIVPGPPVLKVHKDLSAAEATTHACEHLVSALKVTLMATKAPKSETKKLLFSAKHQVEVVSMLLDVAMGVSLEGRAAH